MTEHEANPQSKEISAPRVESPSVANRQSTIGNAAAPRSQNRLSQRWAFPVAAMIIIVIALAWSRSGALGLPSIPRGVTLESAGLANLEAYAQLDAYIRSPVSEPRPSGRPESVEVPTSAHLASGDSVRAIDNRQSTIDNIRNDSPTSALAGSGLRSQTIEAARLLRAGLDMIERGDEPGGLALMRDGVRLEPSNLVLGNAYRMAVFRLQRTFLQSAHQRAMLVPTFPPHLDNEPIAFFESLAGKESRQHSEMPNQGHRHGGAALGHATRSNGSGSREARLQLALAWVDKMLLFPALEIKAPSSVEAVEILTELIDDGNPGYVPALFARGLNHLHRPARLVWPESENTPPDAAAKDIGLCVAIGRRMGAGSDRLQATLAIALGDAYVKAGRYGVARSWWQIAQNLSGDDDLHQAIRRRYAWHDEEMIDRLEEDLDRARSQLDNPMTDLALMWN